MKLTEKKVHELIHYINFQISECQELEDAGYTDYRIKRYALLDALEYVEDLFDAVNVKEEE